MKDSIKPLVWASIALFAVSVWGLQFLSLTPDNRVLLDPQDPRVVNLLDFEDKFRAQNNVGLIVSCEEGNKTCRSHLPSTIRELHRLAYSIPHTIQVESLDNHPALKSDEQSIEKTNFLDSYCQPECPGDLFEKPHLPTVLRLANSSGTTMAVYAALQFDTSETDAVFEIQDALESIERSIGLPDGATIHFIGRVPLMYAFIDASVSEISGFMGLALALITTLLVVAFNSVPLALVSLGLSTATILTTLGIAGWSGLVISTGSAPLPTVILTLTSATAMHYFMHIVRLTSEDPARDHRKNAYGAVTYQFVPTCLTALTTCIAMMSMLLVESPPFRELGLWTAISMPICCLYLFTLVPIAVEKIPKLKPSRWQLSLQPILNKHARAAGKRRVAPWIAAMLAAMAAANISQLNLDDDFVRYFSEDTRFRSDTEHVAQRLIGPTFIEISATSEDSVYEPDFLLLVEQLAEETSSLVAVQNVYSIVDLLDYFAPHLVDQDWRILNSDSIAQLILAYELSLVDGQSKSDLVAFDNRTTRISVVASDISSNETIALEEEIQAIGDGLGIETIVTGESIPLSHLSEKNIPNIALSLFFTILGTCAVLAIYFKSARIGAILFFTTVVPIVSGFGIWTLYENSIGIAATIILCICTGVVIDDTVHVVYRFRYAQTRMSMDVYEAVAYAIHRVGNAICTTTLILALGFGVLTFSAFAINSAFGACTVLVLVGALLIDLLILPSLLTFGSLDKTPRS